MVAVVLLSRWMPADMTGPSVVVGAVTDSTPASNPTAMILAALLGVMGILAAYAKWSLNRVNAEKDAAVAAKDAAQAAQIAAKDAELGRAWDEVARERERGNVLRDQLDAVTRLQIEQGIAAARDNSRSLDAVLKTLQGIEHDREIAQAAQQRARRGGGGAA